MDKLAFLDLTYRQTLDDRTYETRSQMYEAILGSLSSSLSFRPWPSNPFIFVLEDCESHSALHYTASKHNIHSGSAIAHAFNDVKSWLPRELSSRSDWHRYFDLVHFPFLSVPLNFTALSHYLTKLQHHFDSLSKSLQLPSTNSFLFPEIFLQFLFGTSSSSPSNQHG